MDTETRMTELPLGLEQLLECVVCPDHPGPIIAPGLVYRHQTGDPMRPFEIHRSKAHFVCPNASGDPSGRFHELRRKAGA